MHPDNMLNRLVERAKNVDLTWMGEIGMIIFFVVFILVGVWVFARKRGDVDQWSQLPLDDGQSKKAD